MLGVREGRSFAAEYAFPSEKASRFRGGRGAWGEGGDGLFGFSGSSCLFRSSNQRNQRNQVSAIDREALGSLRNLAHHARTRAARLSFTEGCRIFSHAPDVPACACPQADRQAIEVLLCRNGFSAPVRSAEGSCLNYLGRVCRIMFMMPSALSGSWNLSSLFFKLGCEFARLEDTPSATESLGSTILFVGGGLSPILSCTPL